MNCKQILEEIEFVETRISRGDGDIVMLYDQLNKLMDQCAFFMCIEGEKTEYTKVYRGPFTRHGALSLKNHLVDKGLEIKIKHRSNEEYDIYIRLQD